MKLIGWIREICPLAEAILEGSRSGGVCAGAVIRPVRALSERRRTAMEPV